MRDGVAVLVIVGVCVCDGVRVAVPVSVTVGLGGKLPVTVGVDVRVAVGVRVGVKVIVGGPKMTINAGRSAALTRPSWLTSAPEHSPPSKMNASSAARSSLSMVPLQFASPGANCACAPVAAATSKTAATATARALPRRVTAGIGQQQSVSPQGCNPPR